MGRVISRANEATDSRRNEASAYFAQRDRSFRAIVTDGGLLHAFFYVTSIGHDSREIAVTMAVKRRSRYGEITSHDDVLCIAFHSTSYA